MKNNLKKKLQIVSRNAKRKKKNFLEKSIKINVKCKMLHGSRANRNSLTYETSDIKIIK